MKSKVEEFYASRMSMSGTVQEFIERFSVVYGGLSNKEQSTIMGVIPHIFRRWYYSALIPGTYLSPANIVNSQVEKKFEGKIMILPTLDTWCKGHRLDGFNEEILIFSKDDHFFVKDLVSLLNVFTPVAEVDETGMLLEEGRERLSQSISICDAFYIEYLNCIAWELGLIKKLPSIGVKRAQISSRAGSFLTLSHEGKLQKVVEGALRLASRELSEAFPVKWEPFSYRNIKELLREPVETDEIFQSLFDPLDIDIYELAGRVEEGWRPSEEDEIMSIMAYYSLGVLFDMWVLTPFSYYLHLIQPLYLEPYNLQRGVEDILFAAENRGDIELSVFAPCTMYDLTSLGEQVIPGARKSPRKQKMDTRLGDEQLCEIFRESRVFGVFDEGEGQRVL